jgi:dUTP pyrophosphatase
MINLHISCEAYPDKEKRHNISYYLYPRSSMGARTPLRLSNSVGIIDAGYRGEIKAIVDNVDMEQDYSIRAGSRLFQLCSPVLGPISFEMTNTLSDTARGEGGFGSTGR